MKTTKRNKAPPDIPGLFQFIWRPNGRYQAVLDDVLFERYLKIQTKAGAATRSLQLAFDMAPRIPSAGIEYLINNYGRVLEEIDGEYESDSHSPEAFKKKVGLFSVITQCCRVVQILQKTIGTDLGKIVEKEGTPLDIKTKRDAVKTVMASIRSALNLSAHQYKCCHRSLLMVDHPSSMGDLEKVPLALRAIDVALHLASKTLKAATVNKCPSCLGGKTS